MGAAVLTAAAIIFSHAYHCVNYLFSITANLNGIVFIVADGGKGKPTSV